MYTHACMRAQVLAPEQVAAVIVHSYPWLPDTMAVAAVVAAQAGDAAALGHLHADDAGGPGAFVAAQGATPAAGARPLSLSPGLPPQQGSRCLRRTCAVFRVEWPARPALHTVVEVPACHGPFFVGQVPGACAPPHLETACRPDGV
jgi:hypothetical protein